ncbi:MAG: hypothetical protein IH946_02610 [Bacteroidetes bacterium]|nr:hypothetical protein [Bacteroidota bacterium]
MNDPFNIPFIDANEENGVVIQTWGEGVPLVVIPGLEGSGESCLHFIVPAVEELLEQGVSFQLCLVNYSSEMCKTVDDLSETIERLLQKTYQEKELLVFSQSFGNLLTAKIGSRARLPIKGIFMISPFMKVPYLLIRLAYLSMFMTPTWLYRATIKPLGRYVFGPTGKAGRFHPFFEALTRATSRHVRRQTGWLVPLNYETVYPELEVPVTIVLGRLDRLVNIEKEIANFESLCSKRNDWKLLINDNNGHVIFIQNEVDWAKNDLVKFLLNG